jgi:hypothetical protein
MSEDCNNTGDYNRSDALAAASPWESGGRLCLRDPLTE